jgi:hypothetical protein
VFDGRDIEGDQADERNAFLSPGRGWEYHPKPSWWW